MARRLTLDTSSSGRAIHRCNPRVQTNRNALALAKRHPEPTHGPHTANPSAVAARAETHQHRLDLVVRVMPRREDAHLSS